jgi:hypothetical protein
MLRHFLQVYISRDVIFDENVFMFAQLHPTAGARYSAEVLLLHSSSRTSSDFHVTSILPNPDSSSPVVLSFNLLQPQKISAPDPAGHMTAKIDPLSGSAPLPVASTGTETQGDSVPMTPTTSGPGDSPGPHLPSTRAAPPATSSDMGSLPNTALLATAPSLLVASTSVLVPVETAPHTWLQSGIRKPKIYSYDTICYGNLVVTEEPQDLCATLDDPNWKTTMDTEFSALVQNKTWHLVPPASS